MRCRDVLALSSAYVDGDLDDRRSSAVRGHLRMCADCERAIADEAAVRDAAANLEPVDPPADLWAAIEQRLAAAEIVDAGRSRLWLWWQAIRPHLLHAGVAVAAVVAAVIWLTDGDPAAPARETTAVATAPVREQRAEFAPADDADDADDGEPVVDETEVERAMRDLRKADESYLSAITELRTMAEEERTTWSTDQAARYDKRVAEFEQVTLEHRKRLAHDDSGDPATRDALFALYQAEIEFLQGAALGEL